MWHSAAGLAGSVPPPAACGLTLGGRSQALCGALEWPRHCSSSAPSRPAGPRWAALSPLQAELTVDAGAAMLDRDALKAVAGVQVRDGDDASACRPASLRARVGQGGLPPADLGRAAVAGTTAQLGQLPARPSAHLDPAAQPVLRAPPPPFPSAGCPLAGLCFAVRPACPCPCRPARQHKLSPARACARSLAQGDAFDPTSLTLVYGWGGNGAFATRDEAKTAFLDALKQVTCLAAGWPLRRCAAVAMQGQPGHVCRHGSLRRLHAPRRPGRPPRASLAMPAIARCRAHRVPGKVCDPVLRRGPAPTPSAGLVVSSGCRPTSSLTRPTP